MRIVVRLIVVCLFLGLASPVSAQPLSPFVLINDQYVRANELLSVVKSPPFFVPDYFTPVRLYYVNEPINFMLDEKKFVSLFQVPGGVNPEVLWDFGDKDKLTGSEVFHTYKDRGLYTLGVSQMNPAKEVATIQINVVSQRNYSLPKSKIKINNQTLASDYHDEVTLSPSNTLTFDASESEGSDLSYVWYFDDGNLSNQKKINYEYTSSKYRSAYYPVLKVIDKNGYESTSVVRVEVQKRPPTLWEQIQKSMKKFLLLF